MNDYPLISVIVPVYNQELFLSRCVESILKQSFSNFELLLINDGSTDDSGRLCDEWGMSEERIKVFHQENAGVSAVRNRGIAHAKGKYIVFVDSDDWVETDYLSHLIGLLPGNEKRGLIIQGFQSYSPDGACLNSGMHLEKASSGEACEIGMMIEEYDLGECGYTVSKLYDRSMLQQYGIRFDERICFCEDLIFMYDYLLHAEYLILGDSQDYAYVKYPSSLSALLHPFEMEYLCFMEYQKRVMSLIKRYQLSPHKIPAITDAMMKCFQRALKTDYQLYRRKNVVRKKRLDNLKKLVKTNYKAVCSWYHPVCKSDRLGKVFLKNRCFVVYDIYMRFLFKLGFVPIFRGPVKCTNQ